MTPAKQLFKARKLLTTKSTLSKFLFSLPPPAEGHPSLARAIGKARDTGMWISTIPTHFNGSVFGNEEFQDGIRLRYIKTPNTFPSSVMDVILTSL
jgi:hypothetical protein